MDVLGNNLSLKKLRTEMKKKRMVRKDVKAERQ